MVRGVFNQELMESSTNELMESSTKSAWSLQLEGDWRTGLNSCESSYGMESSANTQNTEPGRTPEEVAIMQRLTLMLIAAVTFGVEAQAQQLYPNQTFRQTGTLAPNPNVGPSPTVSPYLALVPIVDSNGQQIPTIDGAYQTYVRPRLEQRQAIQQQQTQIQQLQRQLSQYPAAPRTQPLTGHRPRFQSYTHYYPQLSARMQPTTR